MDDRIDIIRRRILEDRRSGGGRSLAEYAEQFPGEDALVARAYAEVFGAAVSSPGPSDSEAIGHYKILKELGRGGQGVVYLAEDTRLHRKVALKVLTGLGPGSEDSVQRLRREAEVASKLEHPGICGVHDAGVANGTPYIAMQYIEGATLADRISKTRGQATEGEPSSVNLFSEMTEAGSAVVRRIPSPTATTLTTKAEIPEILRVFEKAAQALHAAHEVGVVHRDIKPGNIMVTAGGQPVILDFGLARAEDIDLQTLTRTGDVFGTPAYMSPEQISGQRIRLDRRSDVYSLGVTLYECLTLRRPFEAPTREGVYQAVMTKAPPDPRKINRAISKDLKVVLETALEKDRDRRYASADALAKDLEAVLEGRPIQARPVGPVGRFARWSKREPAKAALLGVILVAFPVIATLVTSHLKDRPQVEAAHLAKIEKEKDEILSEAGYELSEGDPKKAIELYTRALEMDGNSPEAAGGLVLAHLELKNAGFALQLLDLHRPLLGDGAAATLLRSSALWALGRKDDGQALMKTAPAPRSSFEHHLFAEKERQNGVAGDKPAYGRALRHVTTAILLSPAPRLSLYTLRATAAGAARDRATAVETAAALQHLWPDSASAHASRGFALVKTDDPTLLDEAIAAYREAIRLKPGHAAFHHNLGGALLNKGSFDESIMELRAALRLDPGDADTHSNLGAALRCKGLLDESIAECREAIRLDRDDAGHQHNLGISLNGRGLDDDAIAAYREAIRLDPKQVVAHYNLGNSLAKMGLIDDAIGSYREAIRLKPDYAEAHCNLGGQLRLLGQFRESLAEYRLGHQIGSRHPGWRYPSERWVAEAEEGVAELEALEARLAAHLAAGTKPEEASELVSLARVALNQGQPALALRWFQAAFEEAPEFADAIDAGPRRLASRAAVLASAASSQAAPDVADAARTEWRVQALAWLEDELAGLRKASEANQMEAPHVRRALVPLTRTPDLAPVREKDAIARLPEAQRARWTKLWADVDALLASLHRKPESR